MSKKKFKAGLENLFHEAEEALHVETVALVDMAHPVAQKVSRIKARGTSKDFTSDLDSLLEEALQDSLDAVASSSPAREAPATSSVRKPLSGIDALIRKTIEIKFTDDDSETSTTKRVTFTVDKSKLEKLKYIARTERAYLKDILSRMISQYIQEYELGR